MIDIKTLNPGDIFEARYEGNLYTLIKGGDGYSQEYGSSQKSYLPDEAVEVVRIIARSHEENGRIVTDLPPNGL